MVYEKLLKEKFLFRSAIVLVCLFSTIFFLGGSCNKMSSNGVASATIGPAGGAITISDGSFTLTIPPGALSGETT